MKSVLHVLNYGASYRGNFIESLEKLDETLHENDYQNVYLFCYSASINDSRKWIEEMMARGIPVYFFTEDFKENVLLIKNIVSKKDVVLVHTHFITAKQYECVNKAVRKDIPILMHMHNHSKKAGLVKGIVRQFLYRRSKMIACSESVLRSLERDYPRLKKTYVDNGVNFNRLDEWSVINPKDYGIKEGDKILMIFGFDFYRKGVDLALKAVDSLRKKGESCVLLVSLSTNFDYVKGEIQKILGSVPDWVKVIKARNDVASLYNMADLFLSPSREEGLPYSVVEAEYSKCSVVLSDISAQVNLKLKYGYWFEDGNVEAFEEQIGKALNERNKKLDDMEAVREHMRVNYSLSEWSKKIVSIYDKVLGGF